MTKTADLKQPTQRKIVRSTPLWIFIIILLVVALLNGCRVIPASSSFTSVQGNMRVEPRLSTTETARAAFTSEPTATKTPTPSSNPSAAILVSGNLVNLRTGPGMNYSSIRKLNYDEKLLLLGRLSDNTWLYVQTSDGQEGWITMPWVNLAAVNLYHDDYPFRAAPPTETSTPVVLTHVEGHWIDIDLSEQVLRAYDGTELVASFLVSTGIDQYPTETGQYHIYVMYPTSTMRGSDYFLPDVPYSMYYSGDFSIHGTYWHHNFGTPMSHGCVNMDTRDAEWLYNWSSIGTLVNIHR
jgi:lipoprotein-anchoring transpeptidase ErfK/SrfK